jgi:hypothetical protein
MSKNVSYAIGLALALSVGNLNTAAARSPYDGSWNLTFVTQRGACDRTYQFQIQIASGSLSHPNLVRLRGRVSAAGKVRASVTVGSKHAVGAGQLRRTSGRGRWAGYSGEARCSGYWIAQRP